MSWGQRIACDCCEERACEGRARGEGGVCGGMNERGAVHGVYSCVMHVELTTYEVWDWRKQTAGQRMRE